MDGSSAEHEAYHKILAQHQALKELLGRIGSMLNQRTASIAEVGDLLGQLGDQLIKHFTLEESGGYFADALTHAPRLIKLANDLLAQHPRMVTCARQLTQVVQDSDGTTDWWNQTEQRFLAFMKELLEHEKGEDRMLQEAYTRDIGATD